MSGGNQVKVRVTSSLPPPLWVYVPVLEIRFVWSLLFPASLNVCFVSSRKALKFDGSVFSYFWPSAGAPTSSGFPSFHDSLPEAVLEKRVARNPIVSAGFLPSADALVTQRSLVHCQPAVCKLTYRC